VERPCGSNRAPRGYGDGSNQISAHSAAISVSTLAESNFGFLQYLPVSTSLFLPLFLSGKSKIFEKFKPRAI
jgi:hypothetical protein